MGVNHGATLIYGYRYQKHKTADEIPDQLVEKAYGEYPGGRDVMEVLIERNRELTVKNVDAIGGSRGFITGITVKNRYDIGTEKIKPGDIEEAQEKLSDELQNQIKQVADIKTGSEPSLILASTIG